ALHVDGDDPAARRRGVAERRERRRGVPVRSVAPAARGTPVVRSTRQRPTRWFGYGLTIATDVGAVPQAFESRQAAVFTQSWPRITRTSLRRPRVGVASSLTSVGIDCTRRMA